MPQDRYLPGQAPWGPQTQWRPNQETWGQSGVPEYTAVTAQHQQVPGPQNYVQPQVNPVVHGGVEPSPEVLASSAARAEEIRMLIGMARSGGGFPKVRYMDVLGPNDQSWKTAYPGYKGYLGIYFCQSWGRDHNNYREVARHFTFNMGKPLSGYCPEGGPEPKPDGQCYVCRAWRMALDEGQKNAMGRRQRVFKYQGFPFRFDPQTTQLRAAPELCISEDGIMRPLLFDARSTVHEQIQEIVKIRGWGNCFNPQYGRPFLLSKEKTGGQAVDVEWKVVDMQQGPLPDVFFPGLGNLYRLDELFRPMTVEAQKEFIIAANLPMPAELGGQVHFSAPQQGWNSPHAPQRPQRMASSPMPQYGSPQSQASYQPDPNPPYANPYQSPRSQQPQGLPQPQTWGEAPPQIPAPQGPPQPQRLPQSQTWGAAPPQIPAPQGPPPAHRYAPAPGQMPVVKTPVLGQGGIPGGVAIPSSPQQAIASGQGQMIQPGQPLLLPLTGLLPDGRHRCFGRYAGDHDKWCASCPGWIKQQCIPQSSALQQPQQVSEPQYPSPEQMQRVMIDGSDEGLPF